MNASVATVLFATIIASLIAMPATPPDQAPPAKLAKADRSLTRPAGSPCAQQNWPNFDAACLRYTDEKQARDIRAIGDQG